MRDALCSGRGSRPRSTSTTTGGGGFGFSVGIVSDGLYVLYNIGLGAKEPHYSL